MSQFITFVNAEPKKKQKHTKEEYSEEEESSEEEEYSEEEEESSEEEEESAEEEGSSSDEEEEEESAEEEGSSSDEEEEVSFSEGDKVKILTGTHQNKVGTIKQVTKDTKKAIVTLTTGKNTRWINIDDLQLVDSSSEVSVDEGEEEVSAEEEEDEEEWFVSQLPWSSSEVIYNTLNKLLKKYDENNLIKWPKFSDFIRALKNKAGDYDWKNAWKQFENNYDEETEKEKRKTIAYKVFILEKRKEKIKEFYKYKYSGKTSLKTWLKNIYTKNKEKWKKASYNEFLKNYKYIIPKDDIRFDIVKLIFQNIKKSTINLWKEVKKLYKIRNYNFSDDYSSSSDDASDDDDESDKEENDNCTIS